MQHHLISDVHLPCHFRSVPLSIVFSTVVEFFMSKKSYLLFSFFLYIFYNLRPLPHHPPTVALQIESILEFY